MDIGEIHPYARNPRKNAATVAKVAASIREFGFRQPIVVDSKMVVVAGHTRFLAAKELGLKRVPVHVATELSVAQIKAYRLADNRTADDSSWDLSLLRVELSELKAADLDLTTTGFDVKELEELSAGLGGTPVPDEAFEARASLSAKWRAKPDQLWIAGRHRIICADAALPATASRLLGGTMAHLVCTDPPYDIEPRACVDTIGLYADRAIVLCGDALAFGLARHWSPRLNFVWLHEKPIKLPHKHSPLIKHALVPVLTRTPAVRTLWKKPAPDFASTFELQKEYERDLHGHGKAAEVFQRMLDGFAAPSVADCYAGTGATVIACERTGRRCFAVERDPATFAVMLERLERAGLAPILEQDAAVSTRLRQRRDNVEIHPKSGRRAAGRPNAKLARPIASEKTSSAALGSGPGGS